MQYFREMGATKMVPRYTYDDYKNWEGNWELINGIPFAMSPAPQPKHQRISANLQAEFRMFLKKCDVCTVYGPIDYKISDETVLQPDMLIVCGEITKQYLDFAPSLVVEILSPSTASKDRLYKFECYQKQGIPYYLIVDPESEEVNVYELRDGIYSEAASAKDFQHHFNFPEACTADINFSEIWQ
ncbi:Uma2 family endonuclease [Taibaiella soli]|uniref:Uma2 family endonuclease n=1 Tax=Taibaiella soli TaxID=1649169 RepID=A0A2W2A773_9BACT|nr:Uma2 family endonuclease [Taibaiella soli]PZF71071.1 Uma2 family endonuclease [Taibaiella soli]